MQQNKAEAARRGLLRQAEEQAPALCRAPSAALLETLAGGRDRACRLRRPLLDRPVTLAAREWPDWLKTLALAVTDAGRSEWIVSVAALLLITGTALGSRLSTRLKRLKARTFAEACLFVIAAVGGSGLISAFLKRAIGRARPTEMDAVGTFHFEPFTWNFDFESFPSGHSTADGALAMALSLLFPAIRVPLIAVGFLLALTRIVIGVHYPSDVIGGFAFGLWFALMTAIVFARFGLLFRKGEPGRPEL